MLDYHGGLGVDVQFGSQLDADLFGADAVCACIGIEPNDQLARKAGIDTDRGILVNERQMTTVPNVFAIGDCAREYNRAAMENWAYANVSSQRAAHAICDIDVPVNPDLWLWSKQGDFLIQMRGDFNNADELIVKNRGRSACYYYLKDDRLACCIAINDPARFGKSRVVYRSQKKLNKELLA